MSHYHSKLLVFKYLFKYTLSASLLCLALTSCHSHKQGMEYVYLPPSLSSINIIDRNGLSETISSPERLEQYTNVDFLSPQPYQKVLRVFNRDQHGDIYSFITSYYPNGFPRQYLEVVNSRAYGAYKEWHSNGIQKIDATVIGGKADIVEGAERTWLFDGCCQAWDETGKLQATIPYCNGELEGVSVYYHDNGLIWKNVPYHKNCIDGMMEVFQEDGSLLQNLYYQNGKKEGVAIRYWCPDKIASEENYCEGFLVSGRYFNLDGECIAQIDEGNGMRAVFSKTSVAEFQEFHNGVLDGKITVLDKYGRMTKYYHIKNNCKQGEEMIFYDAPRLKKNLAPKISMNWFDGKIQGIVKTWYESGQLESQREMNNNRKSGHSTAWYDDGSLMMIEEYNQDKLVKGEYFLKGEKISVSDVFDGNGTATIFGPDGSFQRKIIYQNGKPLIED